MSKFEVGDIVKALPESDDVYSITNTSMNKAVVVGMDDGRINDITLKIGRMTYDVNSKYFEKIGHMKPFNRAEVIAILVAGKKDALEEYDLRGANLSGANLSGANLIEANLSVSDLRGANLSGTDLRRADLTGSNLSDADLSGAILSDANLSDANLSQAKGLLDAINFMEAHFERTSEGYIVYKSFGEFRSVPKSWEIKPGAIISENVNPNRTDACGCGINLAPLEWVKRNNRMQPYKLLIRYEWMMDVVVPYNTDGKIRCGRAEIIGPVED